MEPLAFATSFTGLSVTSNHARFANRTSTRPSHNARTPKAILGSRTTSSPFGTQQAAQTFTVKVMQKDRCTKVEVDRETNLRTALLDANIDLYTLGGKLRNCGGGGQCGTCLIQVEDGVYNTNGRTPREEHLLEQRPDSWRLACRTLIHGDVTVRTKPRA